ncbi:MAG: protein kinase, partial [Myxococcales bacterium]|nr:protein kinase [Myxococcales bacterium]
MGGTVAGAKTLGRYELVSEVAKGQLGPLWAAKATGDDPTPVLVRRVSTAAPTTPDEIDSLCEGAWWMLELSDPGVARGIDVVKTEGELGVVMEYAEGEVLRSLLRLASFKRRPIPVHVGLRIAVDVLEAVEQAAAAGAPLSAGQSSFVAGGIVPDSVLVGRDGHARLLDIGVLGPAARVGPIARHPEMASYAAPEQLDDPSKTDLRANVYAVGVMLWEMLSGKRLFVGSTHQAVVEKVKAGGAQRLDAAKPVGGEAISTAVADIVAKAMETSADARHASPKELREALEGSGEVATREQVAALVEDFAGNTLAARKKLIEKALSGAVAKPADKPVPKPVVAAAKAPEKEPAKAPPPPQRPPPRKATLIGIQPVADAAQFLADLGAKPAGAADVVPPPRPPLESLDAEELESISKVEIEPFPGSEAPTKPATQEAEKLAAQSAPEAENIKTQFLGTPAPDAATAIAAAAAETASPKPPEAGASPKPPVADIEPPPASLDVDVVSTEPHKPDNAAGGLDWAAMASNLPAPEGDDEPTKIKEEGGEKKEEKRDESAVAWVGPPPGTPLDEAPPEADAEIDEPLPSIVPERTQRMRKMVAVGIGALVGLLALALLISKLGGKGETDEAAPTETPAATKKAEEPKKEEPKAEEPKKEEPKAEEPKAEEPKKEEPKAEEPKKEEPK